MRTLSRARASEPHMGREDELGRAGRTRTRLVPQGPHSVHVYNSLSRNSILYDVRIDMMLGSPDVLRGDGRPRGICLRHPCMASDEGLSWGLQSICDRYHSGNYSARFVARTSKALTSTQPPAMGAKVSLCGEIETGVKSCLRSSFPIFKPNDTLNPL